MELDDVVDGAWAAHLVAVASGIEGQLPGGVCGLHVGGRVRAVLAGKDDMKVLVKVRG
jgi:hypothetical protein